MSEITLYKQKEFSRLTNLSRKALLIYEEKGLLTPHKVVISNGYRFYSEKELEIALRISFLKNLDFSLPDITLIIKNEVTLKEQLQSSNISYLLQKKMRKTLNSISALNLCIENPDILTPKLYVRNVSATNLITIESWGDANSVLTSFSLLSKEVRKLGITIMGSPFTYYFNDSTIKRLHYKACYPISTFVNVLNGDIKTERFSEFRVASIVHFGSYELLPNKYEKLIELIDKKSIKTTGCFIEIYLTREERFYSDSTSLITEIGAVL